MKRCFTLLLGLAFLHHLDWTFNRYVYFFLHILVALTLWLRFVSIQHLASGVKGLLHQQCILAYFHLHLFRDIDFEPLEARRLRPFEHAFGQFICFSAQIWVSPALWLQFTFNLLLASGVKGLLHLRCILACFHLHLSHDINSLLLMAWSTDPYRLLLGITGHWITHCCMLLLGIVAH